MTQDSAGPHRSHPPRGAAFLSLQHACLSKRARCALGAVRVQHTTQAPNRKSFSFEHRFSSPQATCQWQPAPAWHVTNPRRQDRRTCRVITPTLPRPEGTSRAPRCTHPCGGTRGSCSFGNTQLLNATKGFQATEEKSGGDTSVQLLQNNVLESLDTFQTVTK